MAEVGRAASLILAVALACGSTAAQQRETISFESRQKGQPVQVTAEVYWPAATGPVPALVIHHGSEGVSDGREGRFTREIVAMGVAAVVIDSLAPRGVVSTIQDQSAVTGQDFNRDALMALRALGADSRIDRSRIGITGFSKGGASTLMAAHEPLVVAAGVPAGLRYALHVPFYPACNAQYHRPQTTGAPIYLLLGGADSYVGVEPCQTYAETLRASGAQVEVVVFADAMHGFDGGQPYLDPKGENYAKCVFQQQADRSWVERSSGVVLVGTDGRPIEGALSKAMAVCRTLGVNGGPNDAAARQSMDDLKSYVRRHLLGG